MSEVLAQLEKKGGGGGELKTVTINNVKGTNVITTLEDSSPRIKRIIMVLENQTTNYPMQSMYDFDVNGNTLTLRASLGAQQLNIYVFVSLNGDQLSVRQTYSPTVSVKFQVYYFVE
jgi:hypothetical protein